MSGDPFFDDVISLLHFEEVGSVPIDQKGHVWSNGGSASIGSTTVLHGSASGDASGSAQFFQGASTGISLGDEFTLEISVNIPSLSTICGVMQYGTGGDSNNRHAVLVYTDGSIEWYSLVGGAVNGDIYGPAGTIVAGTTHNLRFVKEGGTGYILVDGAVVGSGAMGAVPTTSDIYAGYAYASGAAYYLNGYVDELRITNVSRGTGAYTPSFPFPDESGTAPSPGEPPVITSQPVDIRVASGATAVFTVVATGSSPLSYQWYENDVEMTGETAASVSVVTDAADHGNWYHVVVTDPNGSVTSANANLAIEQNLAIIVQPKDLTARGQDPWQFTVEATGVNLTYQWYTASDDQPIAGETGSSYSGTAFSLLNGYSVYVIVSDDSGSVQSVTATLTVLPAIVTATTYLWYPDGFPCPEIQYGENVIGFTQPTLFDSGWQRLRRNYLDFIRDASFTFRMDSYEFGIWMEWAETDAYRDWWYIVVDDETLRCRFSSQLSWTYGNFDKIAVQVTAEVADYNADIS